MPLYLRMAAAIISFGMGILMAFAPGNEAPDYVLALTYFGAAALLASNK